MQAIVGHTMGTPEYKLLDALSLFTEIGLDGAEIVYQKDYGCGLWRDTDKREIERVKKFANEHNFKIVALTPYANRINSLNAEEREEDSRKLKDCIQLASNLGASVIRIYGGKFIKGKDSLWDEKKAMLVDTLRELGNFAGRYNVTLAVETHFNTMTDTAHSAANIIEKVDHKNVGVLYDQPNLSFQGTEDYKEAIKLLSGHIVYVHVKDFVFKGEDKKFVASAVETVKKTERNVVSRIPGQGIIPWKEILKLLKEIGYRGALSLEYERRWHPQDLPDARIGMKEGGQFIRKILEEI